MQRLVRNISFLKAVLLYSLTAFGGPSGHFGMMMKTFVQKRKDLTEEELMDIMAFCQLLPGASSTQTIMLVGYRKGGSLMAIVTLLLWMLPACFLMTALSFWVLNDDIKLSNADVFRFIQPMAIGFLVYATISAYQISVKERASLMVMLLSTIACFFFFNSPWVFPLVLIAGGCITNVTARKRLPPIQGMPFRIRWGNILVFIAVFAVAGFLSENARKQEWPHRKAYNLFENFYRFGSIVFGGGDVLIPVVYEQYVVRPSAKTVQERNPNAIRIDKNDFLTGAGVLRAIPGPVFSFSSYTGALAMKGEGRKMQWIGGAIGAIAIFLPSALLVLFFYPVWHNLKKYPLFYRALEGIKASVVGILLASALYLIKDNFCALSSARLFSDAAVVLGTIALLWFTKIKNPVIVAICLVAGLLYHYL